MSFLSVIETIGKDIVKGAEVAAKIPGVSAIPIAGPIIVEVGQIVSSLETSGKTLTSDEVSQIVQIVAAASAVKQSSGVTSSTQTVHTTTSATSSSVQ